MRTLDGFVRDGRMHHLGTSTFAPNAWAVAKANELADRQGYEPFTVARPRYNLVDRAVEENYLEMCRDYGLGVCPWSPLGSGLFAGKYCRGEAPPPNSRGATEDGDLFVLTKGIC